MDECGHVWNPVLYIPEFWSLFTKTEDLSRVQYPLEFFNQPRTLISTSFRINKGNKWAHGTAVRRLHYKRKFTSSWWSRSWWGKWWRWWHKAWETPCRSTTGYTNVILVGCCRMACITEDFFRCRGFQLMRGGGGKTEGRIGGTAVEDEALVLLNTSNRLELHKPNEKKPA